MLRQLGKLSALQVTKLVKPGLYGDGGGLTLQITKAGVKSWLFRFMREGKAYGTLMALLAPFKAIVRVLLQTTRMVVGVAVVAKVPSQLVANRM